jgi:hypothetical protein
MKREHIRDALYAALEQLLCDSRLFWSELYQPQLTAEGREAVLGLTTAMGRAILDARRLHLEDLAKDITLNTLIKDNNETS